MKGRHRRSLLDSVRAFFRRLTAPFRKQTFAFIGYLGCGLSGSLVIIGQPSRTLVEQGGRWITYIWSGLYVLGALLAVVGLIINRVLMEIIGAGINALISFTWSAALIFQAIGTGTASTLTGAFVSASLAGLLAQRWIDATQIPKG